jgi:hypothetical protein
LSYLSIGNQAEDLGDVAQTLAANQYGGILQINTTAKDAYQMAFTPGGIYYRHISPSDGTAQTQAGEKGDFTYMDNPPAFSALPLGAMNEEQINAKLAGYLTTGDAQTTYLKKTDAATVYVSASTYNTYVANHASADGDWDSKFNDYQTVAGMSDYLTTDDAASTYQSIEGMSDYLTTANAASTYLTAVSANDSIFSGDGTTASPLNPSIGDDGYYAFWKNNGTISLAEIEDTSMWLTSGGTSTQATLGVWLQRIIDAIAALQPQQQPAEP